MIASGFFTRGVTFKLPHPPIPLRLILIVDATLQRGLELLRESPPPDFNLGCAAEDTVTFHLHWVIANRLHGSREVPGFDKRSFGKVWREPKVTNFDGTHPDKMPDLVFDLKRDSLPVLSTQDAFYVECKPVDATHSAGQHYCDKGLQRFVIGDYAWTMQEAMMVAYVRDRRSIARHLIPALARRRQQLGVLKKLEIVKGATESKSSELLSVTCHSRQFPWPKGHGLPCEIRIFHSWHSCS